MKTTRLRGALALIVGAALALSACGGGDDSSDSGFSDADASELEGTEIKVLMPYKVPEEMLLRTMVDPGPRSVTSPLARSRSLGPTASRFSRVCSIGSAWPSGTWTGTATSCCWGSAR